MTNLDSILKSRDLTLSTEVRLVSSVQFSHSVMSDSLQPHEPQHARPPCPTGSWTNCRSPPKPMFIESVMPSNHLILCRPLLLLPPIPPSIRVFSESTLHMRWPKYWSFRKNHSLDQMVLCWQSHLVKAMVFPVVMYGYESWTVKKAERQKIDAFELWGWRRLLESSLDCKEIQPIHPKGDQSWVFIERTNVEAEAPILWSPDVKS